MKKSPKSLTKEGGPFALFELLQFRWLYASNMAFFFAMNGQGVVRAWLAFKLTDSELALGMVMFAVAVPMFFLSPIGGVVSDRRDRRNVVVFGQFSVFVTDLCIFLLLLAGRLEFWHLLASAAINGCAFPFIMPARNALVVNVVGKSRLERAMALNMAGMNATRVLGPAAAGFLIDAVGATHTYLMGVILYATGVLCMFQVDRSRPTAEMRALSPKDSIIEGFTYMRENRLVLILLLFGLIPMFLAMPFQNLLVVFAEKIWDVGSRGFGLLSASMGVGGILGAFWVATIRHSSGRLRRMMLSMFGFGTLLLCFALSPYFLLGLFLVFLANACVSVYNTLNNTAIQLLIPDKVRGRVTAFLMMSFSLPLLGTLPVAAVAEVFGAPIAVGLASVLAVLVGFLFFVSSSKLRNMDASIETAMRDEV
ncbi:MAG: MFS transporter [Proteobacteria bacterium]|nr:MFS transporter [Pseudomonadota bacterium]